MYKDNVLSPAQCEAICALHAQGQHMYRGGRRVPAKIAMTPVPAAGRVRVDLPLPEDIVETLRAAFAEEHVQVVFPVGHIYRSEYNAESNADTAVKPHLDAPERLCAGVVSTHTLLIYATTPGTGGRTIVNGVPVDAIAGRVAMFSHKTLHSGEPLLPGDAPKVIVVARAVAAQTRSMLKRK